MSLTPTVFSFFFFNDTATTEIYTLSLHDALPISNSTALRRHQDATLGVKPRLAAEADEAAIRALKASETPQCRSFARAGGAEQDRQREIIDGFPQLDLDQWPPWEALLEICHQLASVAAQRFGLRLVRNRARDSEVLGPTEVARQQLDGRGRRKLGLRPRCHNTPPLRCRR